MSTVGICVIVTPSNLHQRFKFAYNKVYSKQILISMMVEKLNENAHKMVGCLNVERHWKTAKSFGASSKCKNSQKVCFQCLSERFLPHFIKVDQS